ncbi:hypothetical protein [Gulosibacter sediminis]|uniref:hypothetical protein n=1 Tax=Gulosibacter sediminis TaxID=1729695 RepID=UPI0024A7DB5C|nr:hypothetical protein [Gulosibacter sediminis]
MQRLTKVLSGVAAAALAVTGLVLGVGSAQQAQAANAADFNPGYIVSDAQFYNDNAMTAAQVQSFLDEKGGRCDTNCLKDYKVNTHSIAATSRCDAYQGKNGETAAQVIYKVSKACNISQKTLLVLLEKETSLVTIDYPANWRYDRAMGYYCPDDPSRPGWCAPEYGGFFNQVYNSAAQYQRYAQSPNSWNYVAGRTNNILYNPKASCGSGPVYIQNQATAALYIYTPYQPNQAALNSLYGTGDNCSAYGNRNFWRLWTDWFGSPTAPVSNDKPATEPTPTETPKPANSPKARLDGITVADNGKVTVRGWAFDADTPTESIRVHVYVDGKPYQSIGADKVRKDVNKAYDQVSTDNVGFNYTTGKLTPGDHTITLYAINKGSGKTVKFSTEKVTITVPAPSATPTPTATATPKPTATATPKPTTSPKPTATATSKPKPTPTPTATSKPSKPGVITVIPPKNTDKPAEDKADDKVDTPTETPKPTQTPKPTTEPTQPAAPAEPGEVADFTPSADDLTAETQGKVSVSDTTPAAGQTVSVTVGEEYAGQTVKAVVFSEPRELGDITVAEDGTVPVQLPADLERGDHNLVIYDANGEVIGWQQIEIVETPTESADGTSTSGTSTGTSAGDTASGTTAPSETSGASASDDEADVTTAPLSVIPKSDDQQAEADDSGLAVTGPANVTPIIAIVALGVAAGLGLLIVARRDRMDA